MWRSEEEQRRTKEEEEKKDKEGIWKSRENVGMLCAGRISGIFDCRNFLEKLLVDWYLVLTMYENLYAVDETDGQRELQ